jgi:hypothetical protein
LIWGWTYLECAEVQAAVHEPEQIARLGVIVRMVAWRVALPTADALGRVDTLGVVGADWRP